MSRIRKALSVAAATIVMSAGGVVVADSASAHNGCPFRRMSDPERYKEGVERVAGRAAIQCGRVYDPDPDSHKPGTRHSAYMEGKAWVEVKAVRHGRPDEWRRIGQVWEDDDEYTLYFSPTTALLPGRHEYRTVMKITFFGSLGPQTKKWETNGKYHTRKKK